MTFASVKSGGRDESSVYGRELPQQCYEAERPRPGALQAPLHGGPDGAPLTDLLAGWAELKGRYVTFADYSPLTGSPRPPTSGRRSWPRETGLLGFSQGKDSLLRGWRCASPASPSSRTTRT